jgi:hypothetical protein
MKKFILLLLFVSQTFLTRSQTTIPAGNVSGIWDNIGSPYLIQGNIVIPNDSTLNIQPGVHVKFQGPFSLVVSGRLLAIGTLSDSITFDSDSIITRWEGIRFNSILPSNDSSKLSYCNIHYSEGYSPTPNIGGGIGIINFSKLIIANCLISKNQVNGSGAGIYCSNSSPVITANQIKYNFSHGSGSGIFSVNGSPFIEKNIIMYNKSYGHGAGIYLNNSSSIVSKNTIKNNKATSVTFPSPMGNGGGIYAASGNIVIDSNLVSDNIATGSGGGGGILITSLTCQITNNAIIGNKAERGSGGAMRCEACSGIISKNTLSNNSAGGIATGGTYNGGGIWTLGCSMTIMDNLISENFARMNGGGIACFRDAFYSFSPIIRNNIIHNNNSSLNGGGIYCEDKNNPSFVSNIITNNTCSGRGGGIACYESSPSLTNNVISNNFASNGGGISCYSLNNLTNPVILNNTISNDSAAYGGGIHCYGSKPVIRNTLLYGNVASISGFQVHLYMEDNFPEFYYCNILGDSTGFTYSNTSSPYFTGIYLNNIDSDPLFTFSSAGPGTSYNGLTADWSLQGNSPCVDGGDPMGTYPSTDVTGNPRVVHGRIDIGAYEALTTGMNTPPENTSTHLNIFPNPFQIKATIFFNERIENSDVRIINSLGVEMRSYNFSGNQLEIEKADLKPGVYCILISYLEGKFQTEKIIIQ